MISYIMTFNHYSALGKLIAHTSEGAGEYQHTCGKPMHYKETMELAFSSNYPCPQNV